MVTRPYRYRVYADAAAVVHESWIVTSNRPLTDSELRETVQAVPMPEDSSALRIDFEEEEVDGEHDRVVTKTEALS